MTRPLLIVGDVQGDVERLEEALAPYPEDECDTIFLGDFFQGGRAGAAGGYRAATLARTRRHSRSILGNHDLFLLCVLEEQRTGWTPQRVLDAGRDSLATVWLLRRGDWADLDAVARDPDLEGWLRSRPLMLRLDDGTLVQHCDDDAYATLGADVAAVNARGGELLAEPRGSWTLLWHTVGRRAFDDPERLERHLAHFDATRVVHGHTPHRGDRPAVSQGGRVWSFDGCFSRYWTPDSGGCGPIEATVALLPALTATPASATQT